MGFIDRIEEARQKAIQDAIDAKKSHARELIAEQEASERKAAEEQARLIQITIPNYIQDTLAIIHLLETLPTANYDEYLKRVADFVGYDLRVGIYSSPEPKLEPTHPLAERVKEVTDSRGKAFVKAKITPVGTTTLSRYKGWWDGEIPADPLIRRYSSSTNFFLDPNPTIREKYGLFGWSLRLVSLTEPSLPSIGINFSKWKYGHYTSGSELVTTDTHDDIYIRILPSADMVITNAIGQQKFRLTSLKMFDDALEVAFQHSIHKVEEKRSVIDNGLGE